VQVTVIDSSVYVDGIRIDEGLEPDKAIAQARAKGGLVWIGLMRPTAAELQELAGPLELHPLAVRDCLREHQRGKLEHYQDMSFIVLQPARYHDDSETVETSEVALFVGRDFIVSVQSDDLIDERAVREGLEEHPDILRRGTYAVVWALIEAVISDYGPVLDGVENDIDEIEAQLFDRDQGVSRRIFKLQREVIDMQHAATPLVDMLERLQPIVTQDTGQKEAPVFRELEDRAQHVSDRIDSFRHTLESALTVHATLVEQENNEAMRQMTAHSLEQNDQVKKVSSWAAILFAPTLVGTIYGMNFHFMPELSWPWGYPMALGLMLVTSLTLYAVFKRKDWL
jgi:magnesium transporter